MRFRILFIICILVVARLQAQTTYLPLHSEEENLLNRLEIKSGSLSPYFFDFRPIARKDAMAFLKMQTESDMRGTLSLNRIDYENIRRAQALSSEWVGTADGMDGAIPSKKPFLKYFYQYQSDMFHVHTDDFFLVVNPVFYEEARKESGVKKLRYINTRGIEARGRLFGKIGFYTMLADDQQQPTNLIRAYENQNGAFPGRGYYHHNQPGSPYDFFLATGYIDAGFFKDHLNVSFGFDRNMSGVGIRSLFNSDFSAPATFLRLRAHWKNWGYQSLFLQLTADYPHGGSDQLLDRKYAAIHQIAYKPSRWLSLGLFESTIFSGLNTLRVPDLVPVIGYQTLAKAAGAQQNTNLGFWFKALAAHKFQFYGQAYFDGLSLSKLGSDGWWGNRVGFQLGGRYADAFSLANLDFQGEVNVVRPFTYGSNDYKNYTHYNQPLAHPLGAGFAELIGNLHYQPISHLFVDGRAVYSIRGSDDSTGSNGINPLRNWDDRAGDVGYGWLPGNHVKALYLNLNLAYEIRPNIFIEAGFTRWDWRSAGSKTHSNQIYGGVRWNITRIQRDFY